MATGTRDVLEGSLGRYQDVWSGLGRGLRLTVLYPLARPTLPVSEADVCTVGGLSLSVGALIQRGPFLLEAGAGWWTHTRQRGT